MSGPFITVTSAKVREGKLDEYIELNRRITETVEAREPRIIAFHVFLGQDQDTIVGLQFHPDPQSFEFHLEVVQDLIANASDILEVHEYKVLGAFTETVSGMIESMIGSGVSVEHLPGHVGGFTRSSAAD